MKKVARAVQYKHVDTWLSGNCGKACVALKILQGRHWLDDLGILDARRLGYGIAFCYYYDSIDIY